MEVLYKINDYLLINIIENQEILLKTVKDIISIKTKNTKLIIELLNKFKGGCTISQIEELYKYNDLNELISNLIEKKVLIEVLDVDNPIINIVQQQYDINNINITNCLNKKILIIGDKETLIFLQNDLEELGFNYIYKHEFNERIDSNIDKIKEILLEQQYDIVIYFNKIYNHVINEYINKISMENNRIFTLGYMKNLQAIIGPIIIPSETPCLNCLELRKISNYEFVDLEKYYIREYKNIINENLYMQIHYRIISNILANETLKLFLNNGSSILVGTELVMDISNYATKYNKTLFNSQCKICNSIEVLNENIGLL